MLHIVWDWNGTLLDDTAATFRAACQVFAVRGLPPVTAEQYRAAYTRPLTDFYRRLFGRDLTPTETAGMDDEFHDVYRAQLAELALADGARQVLAGWRQSGGSQSLLSMFRHEELLPEVRRHGIESEFVLVDGLVGPGGGRKVDHLRRHLAALRLGPEQVLVVGDSTDDAAAAGAVGARCVLYDGGSHPPEVLRDFGVPVVGTLADAVSWAAEPR
ncbi:MAG TPA: HAD hydrolase-like protein [Pseudonocardia sp.]|jgi:phosphoglycolate phosphatase-like HAD superfamily hydrolase